MQLHIKCVDRCESVPSGTTEISTVKNADGSTQVNEHLWLKTSCGRVYFLDLDSVRKVDLHFGIDTIFELTRVGRARVGFILSLGV